MHSKIIHEKGIPLESAGKAIIFLHGRGGTADDIITLSNEFGNSSFYYAAPQASNNTWYPFSFLAPVSKNEPWLSSSLDLVRQLSGDISSVVGSENLFIIGFSQGACLSLEFASRFAQKYGGVAAFTGGLIGNVLDKRTYSGSFQGTKVFLGNSDMDPHVPLRRTEESGEIMKLMGADVTIAIYPGMPHIVSREEIEAVKQLMNI